MARFATSPTAGSKWHRPVAVPSARDGVFGSVQELVSDLGWNVESCDEATCTLIATKPNGLLGGTSRITVTVTGPDGLPSSETNVASESSSILSRDKKNVASFVRKLWMRTT
jgi:uncharacterized membrane protein YdfJ with MMPL/SSD domain